jgi:hypothetical protein
MEQLAGRAALVADHRCLRLQGHHPAEPEPAQHGADGRDRSAEGAPDAWTAPALPAQTLDRGDRLSGQPAGRSGGRRASVMEGRRAARPIPRQPDIGGALRHTGSQRRVADAPAVLAHPLDQKESTMDRHARILMNVHPRLPGQLFRSRNHSFNPRPRMNNLHSNDS